MATLFELAGEKIVSDRVVEAGGIKLLIKVMNKGTPTAKALAAGVLGKLAIDIDLLVKMASTGAIPPLVRLFLSIAAHELHFKGGCLSDSGDHPIKRFAVRLVIDSTYVTYECSKVESTSRHTSEAPSVHQKGASKPMIFVSWDWQDVQIA